MRKNARLFILVGGCSALVGALIFALFILYLSRNLPTIEELQNFRVAQSTKIYDRNQTTLLYEISGGERRTVIPFSQIPQDLKDATVAIEDERFYESSAFDVRAYLRAIWVNIRRGGIVQGGSTITLQLAKNAFLSPEQTMTRKLKELLLAIRLDREYSKDEILGLYLNQIPYGLNAYGVEAASQMYFKKSVGELSLPESALLAALPKAPSKYSPWGSYKNELVERQQFILSKMQRLGMISSEELAVAMGTSLVFAPEQTQSLQAPHFVIAVQEYLIDKYGDEMVRAGGLQVVTTLDADLQKTAQQVVAETVAENERLYGGTNGALVAEDPKTGQLLALVGSRNYFDVGNEGNFNVATQGLRQPGSALKPFVYLAAFEKGYTPETTLFDVPTEFTVGNPSCPLQVNFANTNKECFHPENFDLAYRGPTSMRQALAQSINIPAVKALYLVGLEEAIVRMNDLGISTLTDPRRYGLSLVLGGGEVHLTELVSAYAVLAADGFRRPQTLILEVRDKNGRVLESFQDAPTRVAETYHTRLINDILSDISLRRGLFQSSLGLTVFDGFDVALKTGTSNDYRDAWAVGYTPSIVIGVWAGNNDNTPMHRQGSSLLAAVPMWSKAMNAALASPSSTPEAFPRPETLPAPSKPILRGEYAAHNHIHNILYYVDPSDPRGDMPRDQSHEPQFLNWESPVLAWAARNIPNFQSYNQGSFPLTATRESPPQITLTSPQQGSFVGNEVTITGIARGEQSIVKISVYVNTQLVKEINETAAERSFSFSISTSNFLPQNSIVVVATDMRGATAEARLIVYK